MTNPTDEQLRVMVAEAMGWKRVAVYEWVNDVRLPKQWVDFDVLPNYPACLNACAEFEKTLTAGEARRYRFRLARNSDGRNAVFQTVEQALCHATARQRCLAYLKVKQAARIEKGQG